MRFSKYDIHNMVSECVKQIISEGISDITYHFASLDSCVKILFKNEFYLTMSSNSSDSFDKKRLFYLSTQRGRSKELGYAGHMGSCVRIQLDGRLLSNNLKGMPVDYWGANMGKQSYYKDNGVYGSGFSRSKQTHHNFEMEDRIVSYEPKIENAKKYITRIDVFIDVNSENRKRYEKFFNETDNESRKAKFKNNIDEIDKQINYLKEKASIIYRLAGKTPVYFYDNEKDFNFMTDNTINDEIKNVYQNEYDNHREINFDEREGYKLSQKRSSRNKMLTVLRELFIVYTFGEITRMKNKEQFIAKTLKQFGLEDYIRETINEINKLWRPDFIEACQLLTSTINAPIRKLNYETGEDDANKIMKFGAYILRKNGVSNFNELARKYNG